MPGKPFPYHDLDLILDSENNDLQWECDSASQDALNVSIGAGYDEICDPSNSLHTDTRGRESETQCHPATEGKGLTRPLVLEHEYGELGFWYESRWEQGNDLNQPGKRKEDRELETWYALDTEGSDWLQSEGQVEEQILDQDLTQAHLESQVEERSDYSPRHGNINEADTGSLSSYRFTSPRAEEGEKVTEEEQQPHQRLEEEKTLRQDEAPLQPSLSSCSLCEEPDYEETLVGCDKCEAWFHISCVFLPEPPPEEEGWECPDCDPPKIPQCDIKQRKNVQGSSNQRPKKARVSENRSSNRVGKKKDWTIYEKDLVTELMIELIDEKIYHQTEEKWVVISERLSERYNLQRKPGSIKNKWGRELRARSGIDERNIEKPDKMTTSWESKEKRRAARKKRRNDEQAVKLDDVSWETGPSSRQTPMFSPSTSNSHLSIIAANLGHSDEEPARKPRPSITDQAPNHFSEIQELSMPVKNMGRASGQYSKEMVRKSCPSLSDQTPIRSLEVQEPSMQVQKRKRLFSNRNHHFDRHDRSLPDQDPINRKRQRHA